MASDSHSQNFESHPRELEAVVDAFLDAWTDSTSPPVISEYLELCEAVCRPHLLVELVKIDLEQRWQSGLRKLIEDYAVEIPELKECIAPQLILEEFRARRLAGDAVDSSEYFNRFPVQRVAFERLLVVDPMLEVDPPSSEVGLSPGDSVDDFDLLSLLGRGAFATVFLARQRSMQRIVAVKVSADHGHEPQMLARLDHANIVRVYDVRSVSDRALRLLYMQYAPGGTLAGVLEFLQKIPHEKWDGNAYLKAIAHELDSRGESPPTESALCRKLSAMTWPQVVCWIGSQLGRALDYAHRLGVLHRDIKPANVLLTAEGVPKLADFNIGFSESIDGSSPAAYFGGSLAYMSPEQLEAVNPQSDRTAEELDGRSDLYSLGVLLWELLTGDRPFSDATEDSKRIPSLKKMVTRRRTGPPLEVLQTRQDDIGLGERLTKCLSSRPEDRQQTGLELAHELELCLDPSAKALLAPRLTGWKTWVRRFPLFTVIMLTLIPNLVAAVFNFLYNRREVLDLLPDAEPTFMHVQAIINGITFPAGILSAGWLAGSVAEATKLTPRKAPGTNANSSKPVMKLTSTELAKRRRHCLKLGHIAAAVGLVLWLIAAPVYPIALHLMLGSVPVELFVHFVASLTICGLIAAAYPFFGVTFVVVRCFYPSLIEWESMSNEDRTELTQLMRQTWVYLVLAACVPLVSIIILAVAEPDRHMALIVLAGGGLVGYAIAVTAFRFIQVDLATLLRAIWRADGSSTRSHE